MLPDKIMVQGFLQFDLDTSEKTVSPAWDLIMGLTYFNFFREIIGEDALVLYQLCKTINMFSGVKKVGAS